jgi:SAM-dependent methyltransferase
MSDLGGAVAVTVQELQETQYHEEVDYRLGSPHLAHWQLYDRLVGVLRERVRDLAMRGLPLDVLEVGAGHGGYTEPALAAGCTVTAVEMSRPSLAELTRRYGTNSRFLPLFDQDGSLSGTGQEYSMLLCVSVLHHIPDYIGFLGKAVDKLRPGGTLLTLQDPIWYDRAGSHCRALDRAGYYSWRVLQGDLVRGLSTIGRRVRGRYDESNPSDMVEYHVVRDGVDEQALLDLLVPRFDSVTLVPYWSNQSGAVQRLGSRLGMLNTFGIDAVGFRG